MIRAATIGFAVLLAACATQPLDFDPPFGHPADMATKAGSDLRLPVVDLAIPGGPVDLASPPPGNGNTGEPCKQSSDCKGTSATCITTDATGIPWPGGYCSSSCNPEKNDPNTGINPACPGPAVCYGGVNVGSCLTFCDGSFGMTPCTRAGYSCFFGCEPTALSECDPTVLASCKQDGGVLLATDGGQVYSGRACVRTGYDLVGICEDGCDPFDQNCPPQNGQPAACYPSYEDGEAACLGIYQGLGEGQPCSYLTQCDAGLMCFYTVNGATCTRFCGGPNKLPCPNNKACLALAMQIPISKVGVCAP
jgi:hypothetical protein